MVAVGYDGNDTTANVSAIPLVSLFSSNGIIFVIIMVALLITVIRSFTGKQ